MVDYMLRQFLELFDVSSDVAYLTRGALLIYFLGVFALEDTLQLRRELSWSSTHRQNWEHSVSRCTFLASRSVRQFPIAHPLLCG
jgi:hypothetical protein